MQRKWGLAVALVTMLLSWSGVARAADHATLDQILQKHVKHGKVDYKGIKEQSAVQLGAFLRSIAGAKPAAMARKERLAFYLNAYNALVIKAVVERLPGITSVKKVKGFFDKVRHTVGGRKLTLNQLENDIIRPFFKDARIHFALVCAARSCPPLQARAFTGATLDRTLSRLSTSFINSRLGVRGAGDGMAISQLFNWYAKDFQQAAGSVGKYLARFHKQHARALAARDSFQYIKYDWGLNSQ